MENNELEHARANKEKHISMTYESETDLTMHQKNMDIRESIERATEFKKRAAARKVRSELRRKRIERENKNKELAKEKSDSNERYSDLSKYLRSLADEAMSSDIKSYSITREGNTINIDVKYCGTVEPINININLDK